MQSSGPAVRARAASSVSSPVASPFDGDPTRRPVIVYTADCTDEATELGEYGDRTSLYTSPVGSAKVVRRTSQYAAPT
jgi:hypothetical protein